MANKNNNPEKRKVRKEKQREKKNPSKMDPITRFTAFRALQMKLWSEWVKTD